MPFTPSHAVVALPFLRTPLAPAAIAVGAMTPDLPLFVRFGPLGYAQTHSLAWLPVTMLVALALLLVWRCALRPAVRELSPRWLSRRLSAAWDAPPSAGLRETFARTATARPSATGILLLILSLALGVVSHIAWDAFSHEGRAGVGLIPALDEQWGPLRGYKWVQHGSSALGLVVIAVWAALWLRRARAGADPRVLPGWVRWVWWLSLPAILLVAAIAGYALAGPFRTDFGPEHLAYLALPPACAVWAGATLVLCIAVQFVRRRGRRRSLSTPAA